MDDGGVVSRLAPLLRVRPRIEQICRFGAQWASPHGQEAAGWAPFHIVTSGRCVLEVGERRGIVLRQGDAAVLPHGGAHTVRAVPEAAGAPATARVVARREDGIVVKANVDAAPDTTLVCGRLRFEEADGNLVLAALPPVVVLDGADGGEAHALVEMVRAELDGGRPGASAVAASLANALVVLVLRTHVERGGEAEGGALALLARRQTARVLAAMLREPGRPWTLDALAAEGATSRATLVRLFRAAAGRPPLQFLAELRLRLGRHRLLAGNEPVGTVAAEVGYAAETAFGRAYARHFGITPGEDRRRQGVRRDPA